MGRTAFIFPGQGTQHAGMGKSVAYAYPEAKDVFDRADRALGFSLSGLVRKIHRQASVASVEGAEGVDKIMEEVPSGRARG